MAQPGGGEAVAAMVGEYLGDGSLVGLGRGCCEGQRHLTEAEREEPVSPPRLAVVVALLRRAGDDVDLAVVQPKVLVDPGDLGLKGALVGKEDPRGAALDDGRRDERPVDIGQRLAQRVNG